MAIRWRFGPPPKPQMDVQLHSVSKSRCTTVIEIIYFYFIEIATTGTAFRKVLTACRPEIIRHPDHPLAIGALVNQRLFASAHT